VVVVVVVEVGELFYDQTCRDCPRSTSDIRNERAGGEHARERWREGGSGGKHGGKQGGKGRRAHLLPAVNHETEIVRWTTCWRLSRER
jgi:hypothetical protein